MRAHILSASAGSGKTYRLAYKFVHDTIKHFHTKPHLYRAILAVTFTNKATEEMKSRILDEINTLATRPEKSNYLSDLEHDLNISQEEIVKRAKSIRTKILHDYSHFTILTIDKFFQRILRAFIKELGLDINYNIELESETILTKSTDSLIDEMPENEELQRWIMEFAQENTDDSNTWDIRKDMNKLGTSLFNESSKMAIEQSLPREQLIKIIRQAEEKIAKVKAELKALGAKSMEIMDNAGVIPSDFKGKSTSFAFIFAKVAAGEEPNITNTIKSKSQSPDEWSVNPSAQAIAPELCRILNDIINLYNRNCKLWHTLSKVKQLYRSYALLQDIYRKVREKCDEEGVMLLSETKYILSRFIEGNDAPFIYEKTGNRFERFMIDEFQDTSLKEWGNFVPLLKNAMSQSEDTSVLIVGDVKQAIYRWRGGDWRILKHGVSDALGHEDTHTEIMSKNYRSLPQIVSFNNMAIAEVTKSDNEALNDKLERAESDGHITSKIYAELKDTIKSAYTGHEQTPCRKSTKHGYVRVDRFEEEPPIIECIESAIARGYSYNDIMILYRSKGDGVKIAKILLDYKQRHDSFNIMTQDSLEVGSSAISNFIIAVMQLSQNNQSTIYRAIMNDYLGRDYNAEIPEQEQQILTYISQLTPEQAFEQIVSTYHLYQRTDEIAYLQAIHEQIVSFCTSKVADIQLFLKMWEQSGSSKNLSVEKSDSTIEMMTIHKAKGLEKKIVIIPYCNWPLDPKANSTVWAMPDQNGEMSEIGQYPIKYEKNMAQTIYSNDYFREMVYSHVDAINILYVALTRAKEELYAFIPTKKNNQKGIGDLLWNAVNASAIKSDDGSRAWVEFGELEGPEPEKRSDDKPIDNILLRDYPTAQIEVMPRLQAERYFEENNSPSLAPRNIGIMMHEILNQADNADDVITAIANLRTEGRLSEEQAADMKHIIEREFARAEVAEWFGEWDEVRRENDIICSHTTGTRRPDRVMISGDRAVVVDYKFGEERLTSHRKQMEGYMTLLREMGYSLVEGYVWYLTLGEIVRIEN